MALTREQLEAFHRDGYIVVEDVFGPKEMEAARIEMERICYGSTFEEYLAATDAGDGAPVPVMTGNTDFGRMQFPTGVESLDRLVENDDYLDIYEQVLGTADLSYCNSHLFMRAGATDTRAPAHPWAGYHIDHDTNCFLPPSRDPDLYSYVNAHTYLHDVEEDGAPMHVVPGSHRQILELIPRLIQEGNWNGRGGIKDLRPIPEFGEPVSSAAKAGSVRFNCSYVVHAAVPFKNKRKQRAHWSMSMCRGDASSFTRFSDLWRERQFSLPFFAKTTPRARSVFGWPKAGDPYYTEETLELLEHWFPGIDVAPYR